jgi:hypothetical protein
VRTALGCSLIRRFTGVSTAAWRIGLGVVLGFGWMVAGLGERLVELLGVESRIVEGVATTPVRQG